MERNQARAPKRNQTDADRRRFLQRVEQGSIPLALLGTAGCGDDSASDSAGDGKTVDLLFVNTATAATLKDGKLTLMGVAPATLHFSDRPDRIAGHLPTTEFVEHWCGRRAELRGGSAQRCLVARHRPGSAGDRRRTQRAEAGGRHAHVFRRRHRRRHGGGGRGVLASHRCHRQAADAGLGRRWSSARSPSHAAPELTSVDIRTNASQRAFRRPGKDVFGVLHGGTCPFTGRIRKVTIAVNPTANTPRAPGNAGAS